MRHALMFGLVLAMLGSCGTAHALWPRGQAIANRQADQTTWNGSYANPAWGVPMALVTPPTAEKQTNWGWGVGNTRVSTITHQFHRNDSFGEFYGPAGPTRPWPSDTTQFGYYYVRGPWF
jgi:hypothetical protein